MSCRAMVTVGVVVGAGVVVTSLGTLVADVSTKDRATHEVSTFKDLTIATLDLPAGELKAKDGVVALNAVPATLTADGTKAFGGMYEQGETLDALSAAVSSPRTVSSPAVRAARAVPAVRAVRPAAPAPPAVRPARRAADPSAAPRAARATSRAPAPRSRPAP